MKRMSLPRIPSLLVMPLLAACAGILAAVPARATVAIGDLVCIRGSGVTARGSLTPAELPGQCPVLVVGVDSAAGMVRVLGSDPWDYRLPARMAFPFAKADLPGTLLGATEKTLSRMVPSPNAGVMKSGDSYGLLIKREGRVDTLAADEWGSLQRRSRVCDSLSACLDSLRTSPMHGLLQGPFLPRLTFQVKPGDIATFHQGRPGKASQAGGLATFTALARPSPEGRAGPAGPAGHASVPAWNWTWALATFPGDGDSLRQAWVWTVGGGRAKVLRVAPGDPFEVISLKPKDLDRDGFPDLIAETRAYSGDGSYSELHFFHGRPDSSRQSSERPGYAVLSLSGSSGEPGGSDVAGDWWAAPPRLYRVTAAKGNDGAPKATHDLRIQAYDYTRTGSLKPVRAKAFPVTFFGSPDDRSGADVQARRISQVGMETVEIRPLPRVVDGRVQWQAGAVAPDVATARRWARLDRKAQVRWIPGG